MSSELALWQEIALFGLALLSLLYVFYFRIWVALAMAADVLFAAALIVCVASVALPEIFDAGARRAVDATPLPAALLEADAKVAALESLPAELIARALEEIGYESDTETMIGEGPDTPRVAHGSPLHPPGPFEARIRPAVESLIAVLLRGTSCVTSFFLLLMALALRSSTSTARELRALSTRLEKLESGT